VTRQVRPRQAGGTSTWSAPFQISKGYAREHCDLGYARTWYTVEGQTVAVGIALANDRRACEGLYVAMSRGGQRNEVYAYPAAHAPADSAIGQPSAPDPELARQRRLQADRENAQPTAARDEQDPITILAPVVRRDDAELSATETRDRAWSDADHLGAMHAIWMDQCRAEAYVRYAKAVRGYAEPADAEEVLKDTDRLWRTVRSAKLAGLDGTGVIRGRDRRPAVHRGTVARRGPRRPDPRHDRAPAGQDRGLLDGEAAAVRRP
jgi:hypothetical protein